MYHHLRGKLVDLSPTSVVLEASGVGYDLRIPLSTFESLKGRSEAVVFTHLHVREDELRLFGFATKPERELFRFLLSVAGVGPSIALAALCSLAPRELARAISAGESKTLQRIKGVGKKLAERIVLELRDRSEDLLLVLGPADGEAPEGAREGAGDRGAGRKGWPPEAVDAVAALLALGYDRKLAEERVDTTLRSVLARAPGTALAVEQLIKECLRSS